MTMTTRPEGGDVGRPVERSPGQRARPARASGHPAANSARPPLAAPGVEDKRPRRLGVRIRRRPGCVDANTRRTGDILAGLPAHVMDELVEDLADAVVAILLSQGTTEPDEEDDASGDLRKI